MKFYTEKEVCTFDGLEKVKTGDRYLNILLLKQDISALGFSPEIKFSTDTSDNKIIFIFPYLFITNTLFVSPLKANNKYKLFDCRFYQISGITSETKQDILYAESPPKQIGSFTAKKINDWISFFDSGIERIEKRVKSDELKNNAFLESIKDQDVKWIVPNKKGYIHRGGLKFSFEIENGHAYQKIELDYSEKDTLLAFLKMSNNKL